MAATKVKPLKERARLNIKNRVREMRLMSKINRTSELAKMTGISESTLSELETQKKFLSIEMAWIIAQALKCPVCDLYKFRE